MNEGACVNEAGHGAKRVREASSTVARRQWHTAQTLRHTQHRTPGPRGRSWSRLLLSLSEEALLLLSWDPAFRSSSGDVRRNYLKNGF